MTANSIRKQIVRIKINITLEKEKTNHIQNNEIKDLQGLNIYVVLNLKNKKEELELSFDELKAKYDNGLYGIERFDDNNNENTDTTTKIIQLNINNTNE
jgi:hypothetical protein